MDVTSKNIQLQYQGYLKTPLLWEDHDLLGLEQLKLSPANTTHFDQNIANQMLLGKRVERFVHEELKQQENVQILIENVQIQNQKITIGEIDCMLRQNSTPIHLEIIYKIYLFEFLMRSRQEFFNSISSQIDLAEKNIALLILKARRFKEINTTYGFTKGDEYLAYVEDRLKKILRPADLFCRIGDNEFALLLPALNNTSHALLAANKIISEFKHACIIHGICADQKIRMLITGQLFECFFQ